MNILNSIHINYFENPRRIIRKILGYNSYIYKVGASFLDFISIIRKEGLRTWFILKQLAADNSKNYIPVPVTLRNLQNPIFVRPGTIDVEVIINNIVREEYGQFKLNDEPNWMIDAGAYIGDTSVYFLSRFPKLKVIALEPHPNNYDVAFLNLQNYSNRVILMKKGLWIDDQNHLFNGAFAGASIQNKGFKIECISIPTLLNSFSIDKIDILKIDIEGAEKVIFTSNPEIWLNKINLLIIEIHGPEIFKLVNLKLRKYNFIIKQYRSILYCKNKNFS
jgi:FkbM family methyltransferase